MMNIIEKELRKLDIEKLKNKKIMLMGRIEHVRQIMEWLRERNLCVEAILDNDKKKQGLFVDDVLISAPEQVLRPCRGDVCIIIYSPKYWEEMRNQLAGCGCPGKSIHILDKPDLEKNIDLVKEGCAIYRGIQKEYGRNVHVFLANCPLGDYYLLGLFFHQYLNEKQIKNYVIVGVSQGIEKLSAMLHINAAKSLTGEESNALIRAWMFLGEDEICLKPLTIWQGPFRFNACQTRQKNGLSFLDTFTKMIYSLKNPIPCYPKVSADKTSMEAIFKRNGLRRDKTVILAPFSNSLQPLPAAFWVELAEALKGKGYSVAVNTGEEREENFIRDSVTLRLEFADVMTAMELAGTVIGMRSGFFDITAHAKCRRIVLYPPAVQEPAAWNSTDIGFCSLKRMGLCGDAYEWEAEANQKLIGKILNIL